MFDEERGIVRLEQQIAAPPAKVWEALTTPELHAKWWAAGDISAEPGHRFELDMGRFGRQPCQILEAAERRKLAYSFGPSWTLAWELEENDGGTRLVLEHSGFDLEDPQGRLAFTAMGAGWRDEVLPRLATLVED